MKKVLVALFAFFMLFPPLAHGASYPDYTGYVNDFAHVLSADFAARLNTKLSNFNKKTTNQLTVVTVDTTQPETIEEYSIHLAEKWKVGQKGKDNGVIMLFALRDHRMRIEVGRGLEGELTDLQSKQIQSALIVPEFKKGNYELGVTKGVNAVIGTITHDASYAASLSTDRVGQTSPTASGGIASFIVLFVIIAFVIFIVAISPFTPLGGIGLWGLSMFWGESGKGDGDGGSDKFGGGTFSGGGSSDNW